VRFADTSFWVALALRRDRHHEDARALWESRGTPVLSTNHVLGELWTFLRRRDGHTAARQAQDLIQRSKSVEVIHLPEETEDDAWRWLERHDERPYSFVDATSFALMRRRGILEALAFDGGFSAAGFVEVRRL
jgi:predicted nucleic acid-binding protein